MLTIRLLDHLILATLGDSDLWDVEVIATSTRQSAIAKMTNGQLAALLSLGVFVVGEEETPGFVPRQLELLARLPTRGWPANLDIIPRNY